MREWQIVIAGTGGQGLMLAGSILSRTATEKEGRNATQRNFYGPEKRGGFASSEIRISDREIVFPSVEHADIVVLLHPAAVKAYRDKLTEDMTVIFDCSCVDLSDLPCVPERTYGFPLTELARGLGAFQSLNIIALGVLAAATGAASPAALLELICETFPGKRELNCEAFRLGMECVCPAEEKVVS